VFQWGTILCAVRTGCTALPQVKYSRGLKVVSPLQAGRVDPYTPANDHGHIGDVVVDDAATHAVRSTHGYKIEILERYGHCQ
jgi:hypothetical protein